MHHQIRFVGAMPTVRARSCSTFSGALALIVLAFTPLLAQAQLIAHYGMGEQESEGRPSGDTDKLLDSVGGATLRCGGTSYLDFVSLIATYATGSTRSVHFGGDAWCGGPVLSAPTTNFGLEAWVYPTYIPYYPYDFMISHVPIVYNGQFGVNGWGFVQSGSHFQAVFGDQMFGSGPAEEHRWTHLAIVQTGNEAIFYVDGRPSGYSGATTDQPQGDFVVGGIEGFVDDVRVFKFAAGTFNENQLSLRNVAVTTTADSGPGSLREAMSRQGPGRTINIVTSGTLTLASPLPLIRDGLTVNGPGAGRFTISGANAHRVFFVDAPDAKVNINDLTIANGLAQGGNGGGGNYGGGGGLGAGGGLFVNAGNVVLSHVSFVGSKAVGGAGGGVTNGYVGGGGGGGLSGNGGTGSSNSGGGGGGYLGDGGNAGNSTGGIAGGGGGGGGMTGRGADGGQCGGGGGGAYSAGNTGVMPHGGAGANQLGGKGGDCYAGPGYPVGPATGGSGQTFGGGGGAGTSYPGAGGNGGAFGGGGGGVDGTGGHGGEFGGGGGNYAKGECVYGSGIPCYAGSGGFGGGGGGTRSAGNGGFGAGAGGGRSAAMPGAFGGSGGTGQDVAGGGGGAALGAAIFVRADKLSPGSLTWVDGSADSGTVTGGKGASGPAGAAGSSMFLLGGVAPTTLSVTSGTQKIAGSIAGWSQSLPVVYKTGGGTLVLSASNTDLGEFHVEAGELRVNGVLPSTIMYVQHARLSGTGSIRGAVALAGGAQVAPGDPEAGGIGTLDVGSLNWAGGASMAFQLGATGSAKDSDQLLAGDVIRSGSGLLFNFSDGATAPACGTVYTLIQSGALSSVFRADEFSYSYQGASTTLGTNGRFFFDSTGSRLQFETPCTTGLHNGERGEKH